MTTESKSSVENDQDSDNQHIPSWDLSSVTSQPIVSSPVAINDAVAILRRDNDGDLGQEVFMGRVVAFADDGRVIAKGEDPWNCGLFMEARRGQFPRTGKWELVEGPKKMFGRQDDPKWEFRSSHG